MGIISTYLLFLFRHGHSLGEVLIRSNLEAIVFLRSPSMIQREMPSLADCLTGQVKESINN